MKHSYSASVATVLLCYSMVFSASGFGCDAMDDVDSPAGLNVAMCSVVCDTLGVDCATAPKISLLDVCVGVSSFCSAVKQQSLATVDEFAWIECDQGQ